MADLRCVVRLNSNHFNSFSFSFVFDETLQLVETPVANPIVHLSPPVCFSDSFEIFHHNLVSVEMGNNVFTDVVVNPSNPTSFSSTQLPKKSFGGASAFALKLGTQIFELPLNLLDLGRIIKPTVRSDSKVVYSEVNTQNTVLRTNVLLSGSNLFREREQEKTPAFFIHPKKTLRNVPFKVFSVTFRNIQVELLSTFEKPQNKFITFDVSTSWEVESDGCSFDNWFRLSFFDHSASLSHTDNSNLSRELETLSDVLIDRIMEFEVLGDFMLPSVINTELKGFSVRFDRINYLLGWINPNFSSYIRSHSYHKAVKLFECFGNVEVFGSHLITL